MSLASRMTSASSLKSEHRRHRAEGLLARELHRRRHVGEHGRFVEGAPERVALAADRRARAFRQRVGDMAFHLGDRLVVDQRALVDAGLGAVADAERGDRAGELVYECVVDLVLREQAVGADAGLPHVAELRSERAFDRGVEIGVVEDDERRVAP